MASEDLYAILGVLPTAEDAVIRAAYRALARLYHPDTWRGDVAEANRRMVEINEAYEVLGDTARRAAYDRSRVRNGHGDFSAAGMRDQDEAFASALAEVEDRWALASDIFPDLKRLRKRLARLSTSLAFSFVCTLLETKAYEYRAEVAKGMEDQFLTRFFGRDADVKDFARKLILEDHAAAARKLNRLVSVMGSDIDGQILIDRVSNEFGVLDPKKEHEKARLTAFLLQDASYCGPPDLKAAIQLAELLGYEVTEKGGFLSEHRVIVVTPKKKVLRFEIWEFHEWVTKNLCD